MLLAGLLRCSTRRQHRRIPRTGQLIQDGKTKEVTKKSSGKPLQQARPLSKISPYTTPSIIPAPKSSLRSRKSTRMQFNASETQERTKISIHARPAS